MEKKVAIFRKEHFNAAHRLFVPEWSDEKNSEVFGKCSNPHYHGHNYDLIVKVTGVPDPKTGYVVNLSVLSDLIGREVLSKFDHKNLNLDVKFLEGQMCSTENLAIAIWQRLFPQLPEGVQLHSVKLYETPRIFVEYFGN